MKYTPYIGEHCYIRQRTGNMWVDEVMRPYTVIGVDNNIIVLQEAKCIFNGPRYYDSMPDSIIEDPNGRKRKFRWSERKQRWQETPCDVYPYFAVFGSGYQYAPYLN